MSVTAHQDGPDLSNQGSLVACQKPAIPRTLFTGCADAATALYASTKISSFSTSDAPNFDNAQAMPNAYFNQSKHGAYMPLKLTHTCQTWKSPDKDITRIQGASAVSVGGSVRLPGLGAGAAATWPYYDVEQAQADSSNADPIQGDGVLDWGNSTYGAICARNLSVATSFTFYVRVGVEIQCGPESPLSPYLRLSPPHDPLALKMYYAIARELKDAYPADYNDLGKLWPLIRGAAKLVAPILMGIPHPIAQIVGAGIMPAAEVVTRGGEAIEKAIRRKKGNPSAADLERARESRSKARRVQIKVRSRSVPKRK